MHDAFLDLLDLVGEDCDGVDCDGVAISVDWDDDAFLDLLDLGSGAGDSGSTSFFDPFFPFPFVDAMIT